LSYLQRESGFIVVGTNWGKSATPEWALNLAAIPRVRVEAGGKEFWAEARAVPIEEQSALWEAFDAMWPAYAAYRERATDRPILMFRLVSL
jgi:deazaflavin-dependent oxidoreductase (nitroreductase family)